MTAPTEVVSGTIDGTGHLGGLAPEGVFIDPEVAVGAALLATHDTAPEPANQVGNRQNVREIGRHMLGLLGEDDASEQQRLGARIILMQGTPTEQKLLFLHDAIDISGQLFRGEEGVTPAEAVRDFDTAHALFEHGNAPSTVRDLLLKSQRGEDIRSKDIETAVADVLAETLPQLPAGECVALLRRARAVEGGTLPLHKLKDPQTLRALIEKVPEVPDGYDKALLADTVITSAKIAHARAAHDAAAQAGHSRARREADEAVRAYEMVEGQAFATLPAEVARFCTQADGRLYAPDLSNLVELGERGIAFDSLTTLASFEASFMWDYQRGSLRKTEPEALNRIAALLAREDDKGQALVHAVTDRQYSSSSRFEALSIVDTLTSHEGLEGLVDSPQGTATMVKILMEHDTDERSVILKKWKDMAQTIDLGKAARVFSSSDDLAALQSLVERGDREAIRDLQALLAVPGFVDEWEKGGLSFYSGSDKDLKVVFTDPSYSTISWQAEKRRLVADKVSEPGIASIADDPTLRLGIRQWVSSTLTINNDQSIDARAARIDRYASFVHMPGVGEAMTAIGQNNPAALEDLWLLELTDDQPHELLAEKMRTLAGMPADCADSQFMHALGRPSEAFDSLVTLQNYGMLARMQDIPMLSRNKSSFARWFVDEGSGTQVEKSVILSDPDFQGQLEKLDGSPIADMAVRSLYDVPAASLRARTADLISIVDNAQVAAFFADTKVGRTEQGDAIASALLEADDTAAAAGKVGELYRDNRELLVSLADLDLSLPGTVALRWAAEGDETYLEEWKRVASGNELFWQFISSNGAGYGLRSQLIASLSTTHSPENLVHSMTSLLMQERPLWLINTEIAKWAIQENGYHEGMMVEEIPIGLPSQKLDGPSIRQLLQGDLLVAIKDMDVDTKRMWLNTEGMTDEEVSAINRVAFGMLQPEAQQSSMAYRLFETIETSRSEELRQEATDRNTAFAVSGETIWQEGMLTHFTTPAGLRPTLVSGNIAGEMIGLKSKADNYPFNVDLVVANDEVLARESHIEKVQALASSNFGPVAMHYRRGPGAFRRGEEFAVPGNYRDQHRLLFGGIPATELSAVSVQSDELVGELKTSFVQVGLYVPIYDTSGQLAFTPHEYQAMREDGNYNRVKPEIVDGAFMREGSQAGSNEGAEMYLPSGQGEPQRWYTKFAQGVEADHLWTEILTDSTYRLVEPELVPETKAVIIDGRFARASQMVEPTGEVTNRGRNRGFILDAWTGNWDAVYNPNNLVPYGPEIALRIDTGNSMDFKADGTKKATDMAPFGDEVTELAEGTDRQALYNGMRQMYPDLTDDDIREQVAHLRERATDAAIDNLVDNVRRSRDDREYIKRTLKARRDYIVNYFVSL